MKKYSGAGLILMQKLMAEEAAKKEREAAEAALHAELQAKKTNPEDLKKQANYQHMQYVTDEWLRKRENIRAINSGVTFVRESDGSPKVRSAGDGLEGFTGRFKDLNQFKGPVEVGQVQLPHRPKLPENIVKQINEKLLKTASITKTALTLGEALKIRRLNIFKDVPVFRNAKTLTRAINTWQVPREFKKDTFMELFETMGKGPYYLSSADHPYKLIHIPKNTQHPLVYAGHEFGHAVVNSGPKMPQAENYSSVKDFIIDRTKYTLKEESRANNAVRTLLNFYSSTPAKDIEYYNATVKPAYDSYKINYQLDLVDGLLKDRNVDLNYRNVLTLLPETIDKNTDFSKLKSFLRNLKKKYKLNKEYKQIAAEDIPLLRE